ncbi:MAG: hypothetical protein HOK67_10340 [Deltaproteobacteria bacterium]|nr:hypothetical protein [Deltaproteobacteria bacterium]MBT7153254.1 hypothetical protein [Deltaproteobacteria bacterium]
MKISAPISILLLWVALLSGPLHAQQIKTYQSNATADILENDIAFAKNRAFHQAQKNAIITAIQELVEPQIFKKYQKQINRRQLLNPKNHLVSVRILNEYSEGEEFTIELEARIQIDTLSDALKQMDLVLKNDTWFPITLLIEESLDFSVKQLALRLKDFHIKLDKIDKVSFIGILDAERREKAFIEDLFRNYPQNRVIYLLETTVDAEDTKSDSFNQEDSRKSSRQINGFQLRILRKSDLEEINKISLKLPTAVPEDSDDLPGVFDSLLPRLTSLLTINSVKRSTYENSLASSYFIDVSGLNTPALRSAFEHRVLKARKAISSFSLVQLSIDMCRYVIQSSADLKTLTEDLQQTNPYFELLVEYSEFNTVLLTAFYHYIATATEPEPWIPNDKIIAKIKESVQDVTVLAEADSKDAQLHDFYIPTLIEKEPNNSNIQFNSIPASTYILGKVENRGDEDIFELNGVELSDDQLKLKFFPEKNRQTQLKPPDKNPESKKGGATDPALTQDAYQEGATIYIDWIRIGKTALAPQIRLYDENFNFINAFSLVPAQKRRRFKYPFSQPIPEKIYIRISDKIGFIQGETGGFKQYQYMMRYSWVDEKNLEPENPIVHAYK